MYRFSHDVVNARLYPMHGQTDKGMIVYFTAKSIGTVVYSPSEFKTQGVGYHSPSWIDSAFKEINSTLLPPDA